jgi:hypothetical protein
MFGLDKGLAPSYRNVAPALALSYSTGTWPVLSLESLRPAGNGPERDDDYDPCRV